MGGLLNPKPPPITPPAAMPDPNNPATMEAARKAAADAAGRAGRTSSILTSAAARSTIGAGTSATPGTSAPYALKTLGGS